jgi:hypothetical protein
MVVSGSGGIGRRFRVGNAALFLAVFRYGYW